MALDDADKAAEKAARAARDSAPDIAHNEIAHNGIVHEDIAHNDIVYPSAIPFVLVHVACVAAIWTGVTWQAVAIGVALYWLRMFAIGAGYHRYFSHRAFSTSRAFQFVLAVLSQSSAQKSVLWWAAKHRHHHLHSDTERDVHSPRHKGFWYSHLGWIFARRHDATDLVKVADFARYPELMWLHRFELAAGHRARRAVLAHRRLARPGGRVLLEHRAPLSRHVLHQLARARARAQALCHRRRFPQQLAARPRSPWARAGTTITTPTRAACGRASAGGRSTRPSTF